MLEVCGEAAVSRCVRVSRFRERGAGSYLVRWWRGVGRVGWGRARAGGGCRMTATGGGGKIEVTIKNIRIKF